MGEYNFASFRQCSRCSAEYFALGSLRNPKRFYIVVYENFGREEHVQRTLWPMPVDWDMRLVDMLERATQKRKPFSTRKRPKLWKDEKLRDWGWIFSSEALNYVNKR
ncbi:hypothetical protein NLG97_g6155 [Lecanicillium saksenae]|uniref:Uncharacterized protein n=1 Tax=Lecanicillium saksenae TaxID=468837 RepID=A0ACC1QSZ9_9HYPO|nr:hypothetical protein NLG97_g6155 [Lecanicillium saksenae]